MSATCARGCGKPAAVTVTDTSGDRATVCTDCHTALLAAPPGRPVALVHRPTRRARSSASTRDPR